MNQKSGSLITILLIALIISSALNIYLSQKVDSITESYKFEDSANKNNSNVIFKQYVIINDLSHIKHEDFQKEIDNP
ncbi:hypothetical protein SFC12_04270 [Lactococcus lactis]|uniref:hypothetical protein n=1 Tax=Lactococcus lactis TaxID=1358 RepID=UPI0035BBC6B2